MIWIAGLLYGASLLPLGQAWRASRHTSLAHALAWGLAAWLAWALVVLLAGLGWNELVLPARYLGVCLMGCAGVAVLGARRPGVAAWNFVVLGLLLVLLLWLGEGLALGSGRAELGLVRTVFLAGLLAAGILNYLPTRLGPAAAALGAGCALELAHLVAGDPARPDADLPRTITLLALAPWIAWALWRRGDATGDVVDRHWRWFRDRYGFFWGQRLRDQFNRSAANNGWPVELGWSGWRKTGEPGPGEPDPAALLATLQALMKRFGVAE
jgi:hypothetical protein